jgi:thiol-disulfide isomerase/thioredoxin
MNLRIVSTALTLLLVAAVNAPAQTLTLGDEAPPLTLSKWVKGDKLDRLEPGQTYVVEFWATWCGPCRVSIPHLTELQKKYKDRVKFIGVSIWEQDQKKVEPFVKQMGDKMDYNVAMDDVAEGAPGNQGKMAKAWMAAAEENGIPTAFVVKDRKVAWIGHPMSMDEPLAKVVVGEYDLQAAVSERREMKAQQKKMMELSQKLRGHLVKREFKEAVDVIDKATADDPKLEPMLGMTKFNLLLQSGDEDAATSFGEKLVEKPGPNGAQMLNALAWGIVNPNRPSPASKPLIKLALKAAQRANDLTDGKNAAILDTLAKAYFDSGDAAKALEYQEKAVKLGGDNDQELKSRLEQYRKAVSAKQS